MQIQTFFAWSARISGHEGSEHAHTACHLPPPAAAAPLPHHLFRTKPSCTTKHIVNKSNTFSRLPPSRATETRAKHAALQRCGSRDIDAEYWGVSVCVFIAGDWFQLEGAFCRLLGWRLKLCAQLLSRLSEPGTQREPDAPQVLHLLQLFSQHARRRVAWCSIIGMMASPERWAPAASPLTIHVGRRSCAPALSQPLRRRRQPLNAHPPHAQLLLLPPPLLLRAPLSHPLTSSLIKSTNGLACF